MHERDLLHTVATMYYVQDETMESIGARLGASRSTISRLLKQAREAGVVQIRVQPPDDVRSPLAAQLGARFGVRVHLVPVREKSTSVQRLDQTARVAAQLVGDWFGDDMVLGLAWGTTLSAIAPHLPTKRTRNAMIVQLNGAENDRSSGVAYAGELLSRFGGAFDADVTYFPTPAFFDYADTKEALWRETSIQRVLAIQRRCDMALFGVGALRGQVRSQVYSGGYLRRADMEQLTREHVVGDICTVFLRQDGSWEDIELNRRGTGPSPADLARIPRRVCVVSGEHRSRGLLGALNAGAVTDLVIDEATARYVGELLARS